METIYLLVVGSTVTVSLCLNECFKDPCLENCLGKYKSWYLRNN